VPAKGHLWALVKTAVVAFLVSQMFPDSLCANGLFLGQIKTDKETYKVDQCLISSLPLLLWIMLIKNCECLVFSLVKIYVLKLKPGKGTGAAINDLPDSCNPLILSSTAKTHLICDVCVCSSVCFLQSMADCQAVICNTS